VFTNEYGELMHPDTFSRHFRRFYNENKFLREFYLHTLRHYFVSTMLHNEVAKQIVAESANHGKTGFLERTYYHPQLQFKREAAERYTKTMFDFSDSDYETYFKLKFATGMRRGECCGLKWSGTDYE
jgi:integrase